MLRILVSGVGFLVGVEFGVIIWVLYRWFFPAPKIGTYFPATAIRAVAQEEFRDNMKEYLRLLRITQFMESIEEADQAEAHLEQATQRVPEYQRCRTCLNRPEQGVLADLGCSTERNDDPQDRDRIIATLEDRIRFCKSKLQALNMIQTEEEKKVV